MTFKKPTIPEVKAFATSIGYTTLNAGKWWHSYESKNWMVGKSKMSKWKSAVWTWFYSTDEYAKKNQKQKREQVIVEAKPKPVKMATPEEKAILRAKYRKIFNKTNYVPSTESEREQKRQKMIRDLEKS